MALLPAPLRLGNWRVEMRRVLRWGVEALGDLLSLPGSSGCRTRTSLCTATSSARLLGGLHRERDYEFCDDGPTPSLPAFEGSFTFCTGTNQVLHSGLESSSCDHEGQQIGAGVLQADQGCGVAQY